MELIIQLIASLQWVEGCRGPSPGLGTEKGPSVPLSTLDFASLHPRGTGPGWRLLKSLIAQLGLTVESLPGRNPSGVRCSQGAASLQHHQWTAPPQSGKCEAVGKFCWNRAGDGLPWSVSQGSPGKGGGLPNSVCLSNPAREAGGWPASSSFPSWEAGVSSRRAEPWLTRLPRLVINIPWDT